MVVAVDDEKVIDVSDTTVERTMSLSPSTSERDSRSSDTDVVGDSAPL